MPTLPYQYRRLLKCNRSYPDYGIGPEVTFMGVQGLWADGVVSGITDFIHRRLLLGAE